MHDGKMMVIEGSGSISSSGDSSSQQQPAAASSREQPAESRQQRAASREQPAESSQQRTAVSRAGVKGVKLSTKQDNSVSGIARVCNLATSFQRFQMLSRFHAMELRLIPLTSTGCTCQRAWSDLFVCVSAHEWSH